MKYEDMIREQKRVRAEIDRLENKLDSASTSDHRADLIAELNWYEQQYCERY